MLGPIVFKIQRTRLLINKYIEIYCNRIDKNVFDEYMVGAFYYLV